MADPARLISHSNDGNFAVPASAAPTSYLQCEELRLFFIGSNNYLALPIPQSTQLPRSQSQLTALATVINDSAGKPLNFEWIQNSVKAWEQDDDVFRSEFLDGIIFVVEEEIPQYSDLESRLRNTGKTKWTTSFPKNTFSGVISSGPYVLWDGQLCKAFRLYDDVSQSFLMATKPQMDSSRFTTLRLSGDFYQSLSVAVPSRISSESMKRKPLQGLRFAVKDVFEVEGLRVTAGNRAFYSIATPSQKTAPILQRLLDQGASLVGTLKTSSLIAREEPTESVDWHAPFNPRGDGYQSAWSSSGASGAAVASYDWVDFTLGTDTTGSSRRPAMANGCFQLRVTQSLLPLNNVVPSWPRFDAPAMFTRDLHGLHRWIGAWIDQPPQSFDNRRPCALVYITDFPLVPNDVQLRLIEVFIQDIEKTFDIKTEKLSLAEAWVKTTPELADGLSIQEYLRDVGVNSFCYGVYDELKAFRKQYWEHFHKAPYVNPVTRWRWNAAETVSRSQYDDALYHLNVYKTWFLEHILQESKRNTIVILPITNQAIDYREDPPEPPSPPQAFDAIWLAPTLGSPELTLPIGQFPYHSRISQRTEYLPVVVSLMGSPGSDMALLDAACRIFKSSKRPTQVSTGSQMFP